MRKYITKAAIVQLALLGAFAVTYLVTFGIELYNIIFAKHFDVIWFVSIVFAAVAISAVLFALKLMNRIDSDDDTLKVLTIAVTVLIGIAGYFRLTTVGIDVLNILIIASSALACILMDTSIITIERRKCAIEKEDLAVFEKALP